MSVRLAAAWVCVLAVAACAPPSDVSGSGGTPVPGGPTPGPAGSAGSAGSATTIATAPSCRGLPTGADALPCLGPGPAVALDRLAGPTVVAVWASWCEPCRRELPVLQQYAEDGGSVLGVDAADEPGAAADLLADLGVTFPSVQDVDAATRGTLGWVGPPATYVVLSGNVVHRITEPITSVAQVRAAVAGASTDGRND